MSDTQNQAEICTDCDPQVGSEPVIRQEDPLDKSTFTVPTGGRYPMLVIEYCDRRPLNPQDASVSGSLLNHKSLKNKETALWSGTGRLRMDFRIQRSW
ncbi:hypothetical protein FRC16_000734 [Serendipita sp. 398]|nr:hypothetical protein FRC16_000734 [Serendipita sp. 398]